MTTTETIIHHHVGHTSVVLPSFDEDSTVPTTVGVYLDPATGEVFTHTHMHDTEPAEYADHRSLTLLAVVAGEEDLSTGTSSVWVRR